MAAENLINPACCTTRAARRREMHGCKAFGADEVKNKLLTEWFR